MLTLIVAMTLSVIVASFITLGTTAVKTSEANFTHHSTLNAGETGIDHAMAVLDRYCTVLRDGGPFFKIDNQFQANQVWTNAGWALDTANGRAVKWLNSGKAVSLGNNREAGVRMFVFDLPDATNTTRKPHIIAEVIYSPTGALGTGYTRQIAAYIRFATPFSFALLAQNIVNLNGQNVRIDSYNSEAGPGTWGDNAKSRDQCTVATLRVSDGGISGSNAKILGYVATGGDNPVDDFGPNAVIKGYDTVATDYYSGTQIDKKRLSLDLSFGGSLPVFVYDKDGTVPTWDMPADGQLPDPVTGNPGDLDQKADGVITLASGKYRRTTDLNIGSGAGSISALKIKGKVTLVMYNATKGLIGSQSVAASNSPAISVGGSSGAIYIDPSVGNLTIYTTGNLDIGGRGAVLTVSGDATPLPTSSLVTALTVFGCNLTGAGTNSAQSIRFAGNAQNTGIIWAPFASIFIAGGGSNGVMNGSIAGWNITANGGVDLHYDERAGMTTVNIPQLEYWVELKGANKRTDLDAVAASLGL